MQTSSSRGPASSDLAGATIFAGVSFHFVESKDLPQDQIDELTRILTEHGATEHSPSSTDGRVDCEGLTHIISATNRFEDYPVVIRRMIAIVSPTWIAASLATKRLANPRAHSPDPRLFLSGLTLCISGLADDDQDAITGGALALGALVSAAITRSVTHVIASRLDAQACQVARAKGLTCKIVRPHWFDDCLRLGRRIPEGPYALDSVDTNPLQISPQQNLIASQTEALNKHTSATSPASRTCEFVRNRSIFLASDLAIATHLRTVLAEIMIAAGARIVPTVREADIVISQYREGLVYEQARAGAKILGNLQWLYHLIAYDHWVSPLQNLLHYPIPSAGFAEFDKFRVSLSNYNGESRIFLESLARASGCQFTRTMKADNTHLVAAHQQSEKCEAAREWGIHIVNHLWLEDSYARGQPQDEKNPRYTYFPSSVNMVGLVGQTHIIEAEVQQSERDIMSTPSPESLPLSQVSTQSIMRPQISQASRPPPAKLQSPVRRLRSPSQLPAVEPTPAKQMASLADKENQETHPSVGRSAKVKATERLHDLAPDIALYEKEKKRVGGVVFGRSRDGQSGPMDLSPKRRRQTVHDIASDDWETPSKRSRLSVKPVAMRLLVTGYERWAKSKKTFAQDRERLRSLGIVITGLPGSCTHVAAPRIMRTAKFLCAMARAPMLLHTGFLEACLKQDTLVETSEWLLDDADGEKRWNFDLESALYRAAAHPGALLLDQTIYVTEGVKGGFETYRKIIEANGGKCLLYRARAGVKIISSSPASSAEGEDAAHECVYLVSGSSAIESQLWPRFRAMAIEAGRKARIVKTDWMLDTALTQEPQWKAQYELSEAATDEGEF